MEEIKENLLNEPVELSIQVDLPTRSKLYSYKGPVIIKPILLGDELAIASAKKSNVNPINIILNRVVPNLDINDLLLIDKLFILIKLHQISNGEIVRSTIACKFCRTDNNLTINLPDLPVTYVPENFTDPTDIKLPLSGKVVSIRFPRVRDEDYLLDQKSILENLWRFVVKIDDVIDAVKISKFLLTLRSGDASVLISHLVGNKYGIQTLVGFECDKCKKNNIINLPLNSDFLSES